MNKMKKLFLLVTIAATMSFAACTNAKTTEEAETTETAEVNLEESSIEADSTIVMDESEADSLEEVVEEVVE